MNVKATITTETGSREIELKVRSGNYGNEITRAMRAYCNESGIEWKNAEISVTNWPEKGRAYIKNAGFVTVGAYG